MSEWRSFEARCLRALLKGGGTMTEGKLSNYVDSHVLRPEFQEALGKLKAEELILDEPIGFGRSRRVTLTEAGLVEAQKAKAERDKQAASDIAATAAAE